MTELSVQVLVSGRVQGVGYRYAAAEQAHGLELGGWVRNLDDGRVEALLSGNEPQVRAMLDWMKQGPPMARVDDVAVVPATEQGPRPFQVRR